MTADQRRAAQEWNATRRLRVYRAEGIAAHLHHVDLLDGSHKAAQAYVDRVVRSAWWRNNCPPSWMGDDRPIGHGLFDESKPPRRIIVKPPFGKNVGGHSTYDLRRYRGRMLPHIGLGTAPCTAAGRPAIADPWVILHELAHVMAFSVDATSHRREFARFFMLLVRKWLGKDAARALREGYAAEGVKYRAR